jgi:hypothetical protein
MLLGLLIQVLVLLLVLLTIDYAARTFIADAKILQFVRLILGLIFLIWLIYAVLPLTHMPVRAP